MNITVEISLPYSAKFKYSGPTEQLNQVKELFSKWIERASSVGFSISKRQVLTSQPNPGFSKKKRKRRPKKRKSQEGKKLGTEVDKQPLSKQPTPQRHVCIVKGKLHGHMSLCNGDPKNDKSEKTEISVIYFFSLISFISLIYFRY